MRFFNNKIPTGTSKKSFADLIKEATSKPQTVKTAAAAAPEAKTANISNFGDKKAEPFGKKDEKDCKKGEEGCDEKEASVKEEPIVTAETKVAEQKDDYEEERRTDVHHMEGTKDQQSGKGNGEPEDNGAVTAKESKKEAAAAKPEAKKEAAKPEATKKAATVERSEKDNPTRTDVHHQENTKDQESKGTNGEPEDCKEAKAKAAPKTTAKPAVKVEAKSEPKKADPKATAKAKLVAEVLKSSEGWKKVANLAPKQKTMLRDYFTMYWPAEFVDALLADK